MASNTDVDFDDDASTEQSSSDRQTSECSSSTQVTSPSSSLCTGIWDGRTLKLNVAQRLYLHDRAGSALAIAGLHRLKLMGLPMHQGGGTCPRMVARC